MSTLTPSSITISAELYDTLMSAVGQVFERNQEIDRLNHEAFKSSLKYQTVGSHLANLLTIMESKWDEGKAFDSAEEAMDYIAAAEIARDQFSRTDNRIEVVREWVNEFIPQ